MKLIFRLIAGIIFSACIMPMGAPIMAQELKPITPFDLSRYLGAWYEIARLPAWFERDMDQVTATYSLKPDGMVKVENAGIKKGKPTNTLGKAKLAGASNVGQLKVAFFLSFYADYTIIALDTEAYRWVMVASSMDYLWILCRTPHMDQRLLSGLVDKAAAMGFDTGKLYYTKQAP
jgi:apolipoprotein D and lipocalin family protein